MGRAYQCGDRYPPKHRLPLSIGTLVLGFQNHGGADLDRGTTVVRDTSLPRRSRDSLAPTKARTSRSRPCRRSVHLHAQPVRACVHGSNLGHPHTMVRTPMVNRFDDQCTQGTDLACFRAFRAHRHRHGGHKRKLRHFCFARPPPSRPFCGLDHQRSLSQGSIQGTTSHSGRYWASAVVVALRAVYPGQVRTPHSPTHRDSRNRCSDVHGSGSTSRSWILVLLRQRRTRWMD
ncbi:unannotated protein [freshwater metagenome]|uniref:Unannotated protein n=1 Tax=freshwater metagenome TaxID=449393 RepID=A0A6J6ER55_9ZZZZ